MYHLRLVLYLFVRYSVLSLLLLILGLHSLVNVLISQLPAFVPGKLSPPYPPSRGLHEVSQFSAESAHPVTQVPMSAIVSEVSATYMCAYASMQFRSSVNWRVSLIRCLYL